MMRIVRHAHSTVLVKSADNEARGIAVAEARRLLDLKLRNIWSGALMIGATQIHSDVRQKQSQSSPASVVEMEHAMATRTNQTVHSIVSSVVMECAMAMRRLKVAPEIAHVAMVCVRPVNQDRVPKIVVEMALAVTEKTLSIAPKTASVLVQELRVALIPNAAMDVESMERKQGRANSAV